MSKPKRVQDYGEVAKEILKVLNKYQITYAGFNHIMDYIRNEINIFTFIDIDDILKEEFKDEEN